MAMNLASYVASRNTEIKRDNDRGDRIGAEVAGNRPARTSITTLDCVFVKNTIIFAVQELG